jgi:SAM-dependent methyltransferase
MNGAEANSSRDHFDALYRASDDPYGLGTRWYEQRKRALILAALPRRRYRRAFEPGCGVGEFTVALAGRCNQVLAGDRSEGAVALARRRSAGWRNVRVEQQDLPADWPHGDGRFDLIVVAELGYFLRADDMRQVAACCERSLDESGTLVACDWKPDFKGRLLSTGDVQAQLAALKLPLLLRYEEQDFLLQVWSRDGRSVAEREGIR